MGQGSSSLEHDAKLKAVVNKLNKMELKDIEEVFMELSSKTQEGESVIKQPTWLNRDKFAEIFGTTELIVEQLFEAFDKDKNGLVDLQEFVTGMALCLHGSVKEKCHLLFKIFNLNGDDGVSREELATVLASCLQSAHTVLASTLKSEGIQGYEEHATSQTGDALMASVVVDKIVKDAFDTCDVSGSGKLEINEFAVWLHKNPKLMNNIFLIQCPRPPHKISIPSITSEFSVVVTPEQEQVTNEEVFHGSLGVGNTEISSQEADIQGKPTTLLQMACIDDDISKTTLQNLFSQPDQQSQQQDNFFDSLGSNQHKSNDSVNKDFFSTVQKVEDLPRPQSQLLSQEPFAPINEPHGGSQDNINEIPMNMPQLSHQLHGLLTSDSLQSIKLSQDSLYEERVVAGEISPLAQTPLEAVASSEVTKNDNSISAIDIKAIQNLAADGEVGITNESFSEEGETKEGGTDIWHPLQEDNSPISSLEGSGEVQVQRPVTVKGSESTNEPVHLEQAQVTEEADEVTEESEKQMNFTLNESSTYNDPVTGKKRRGYSFWQPSPQTQQLLHMHEQGNQVNQNLLTFPSVLVEGMMGDPIKELVTKYLGEQEACKRPTFTSDQVELNENGLRQLLASGCWRAAVDFTSKYLTAHGQGIASVVTKEQTVLTPTLIQVWFVRLALLVKLRMFSSAEAELNAFNDFEAPDLYYQFYPHLYPGKKGSMIPFSLRMLHAELPQHNGRPNVALDRLYGLLGKANLVVYNLSNGLTEDGVKNEALAEEEIQECIKLWKARKLRLRYSIGNCFLGMKEFTLAVKLFEQAITLDPDRKASILSGIGRIFLQLGDLKSAQMYFKRVDQGAMGDAKTLSMITMNKGYLSLSQGNYEDSYQQFMSAIKLDPDNLAACNNAAVCLLFLGKVKEASNILETMVWRSPEKGLHEDILFNLNTVYELETSRALQKKYKLLDLVCKHRGDGFAVQCLKLT